MILTITQIENHHKTRIVNHSATIKEGFITCNATDMSVSVKITQDHLSLQRSVKDYKIVAEFDLNQMTKMVVNNQLGMLVFDVKTIDLDVDDEVTVLEYELYTQGNKVGEYQFVFELKKEN